MLEQLRSPAHAGRVLKPPLWFEEEVEALRVQVQEQRDKGHSQNAAFAHVASRTPSKGKPGEMMTAGALKSLLQRRPAKP